jgi:hypothetical protein
MPIYIIELVCTSVYAGVWTFDGRSLRVHSFNWGIGKQSRVRGTVATLVMVADSFRLLAAWSGDVVQKLPPILVQRP